MRFDPSRPGHVIVAAYDADGELLPTAAVVSSDSDAAATIVATIAAGAGERAFLDKVIVSGLGATGAGSATLTIAGNEGDDIVVTIPVPAGATLAITPLVLEFDPPLRAAADADDITATVTTFGAGNTVARVTAIGRVRA